MPTFARLAVLRIAVIIGALVLLGVIASNAPHDPTVPPKLPVADAMALPECSPTLTHDCHVVDVHGDVWVM